MSMMLIESLLKLSEALKRKREMATQIKISNNHSPLSILKIQNVLNEMMKTNSLIKSWKFSSNNQVAWIRGKNLTMKIVKYLVEIGNLTFNLVNREISQNSKLKVKGKVMDLWSKVNLIKRNKFPLLVNL